MSITETPDVRDAQTPEKKRRELYDRQAALLDTFLEHRAISQKHQLQQ